MHVGTAVSARGRGIAARPPLPRPVGLLRAPLSSPVHRGRRATTLITAIMLGDRPTSPPPPPPKKDDLVRAGAGGEGRVLLPWPARRPWSSVAYDKLLDTVDDVALHARRALDELPARGVRAAATISIDRSSITGDAVRLTSNKPVVLVLGTGWGAHAFVKVVDTTQVDVVVVSPSNHFLFTPMLPSAAVGTVEFRSLLEPIRTSNPAVTYLEAACERLDVERRVALCTSAVAFEDGRRPRFEVPYDRLLVAVGEQPATFGVPGVEQYAYFMKVVADARALRKRVQAVFELASLPSTTDEERRRVLHFVVVGGGPAGCEFAGTLADFVTQDLRSKYPEMVSLCRVTLLQSAQSILTQFQARLQQRALENFASSGIEVRTGVRVTEVTSTEIRLKGGEAIPYGVCVWSTGNATRPLVSDVIAQLPPQAALNASAPPTANKLVVDPFLRVIGARDVFAIGDASAGLGERLPATAQVAGQQGAYAARLINRGYAPGLGGMDQPPPARARDAAALAAAQAPLAPVDASALSQRACLTELDLLALASGDSSWVSGGGGGAGGGAGGADYYHKPFEFLSLGLLAYVGNDKALTQVEAFDASLGLYGSFAFLLWRSVYITKQVSFRNRVLILFDWLKCKVFGRDLSQF